MEHWEFEFLRWARHHKFDLVSYELKPDDLGVHFRYRASDGSERFWSIEFEELEKWGQEMESAVCDCQACRERRNNESYKKGLREFVKRLLGEKPNTRRNDGIESDTI